MVPTSVVNRLRAEARQIVVDPAASVSLRTLAWRFLKQWGLRP